MSATSRVPASLRGFLLPLGEFIHVSAIYMGLAVLTTLALSLVLPSMRQQSQQLHEVVLAMFQSNDNSFAADDGPESWTWAQAEPQSTEPQDSLEASSAEDGAKAPASAGFGGMIAASLQKKPISGLRPAQANALGSFIARKYQLSHTVANAMIRTAAAVGAEFGLDTQLLLAVIAIESRYNPYAESSVGAQGLMQVMTRVHQDKLEDFGGAAAVFEPVTNIRVGGQILRDCIKRRGSVKGGLACYVGSSGPGDGGYGARVLAELRRMALASGLAPKI